jgi:hypothetical protein
MSKRRLSDEMRAESREGRENKCGGNFSRTDAQREIQNRADDTALKTQTSAATQNVHVKDDSEEMR